MAAQVYAQQARDRELIGYATDLRQRAESEGGKILTKMQKAKGAAQPDIGRAGTQRGSSNGTTLSAAQTLAEIGITKNQSSRWQKLTQVHYRWAKHPARNAPTISLRPIGVAAAEEDRRRVCRERRTLVGERVRHVNRIKGLLFAWGVLGYEPLRKRRRHLDAGRDCR